MISDWAVDFAPLLPLALWLWRQKGRDSRWFIAYLIGWLLIGVLSMALGFWHINNHWCGDLDAFFTVGLGFTVLTVQMPPQLARPAKVAQALLFMFLLLWLVGLQNGGRHDEVAHPVVCLVGMAVACTALIGFQKRPVPVWGHPFAWVALGLLIGFMVDLLPWAFARELLIVSPAQFKAVWIGRNWAWVAVNALWCVGAYR